MSLKTSRQIADGIYYIGADDRRLALFENMFPVENGVSYNSYLIDDEKTAVLDSVDRFVSDTYFENLSAVLGDRPLDYIVVHHMEPDHAANIGRLIKMYPSATVVCSAKAADMIKRFFDLDIKDRLLAVKEGDEVHLGKRTLRFIAAPMVHWPEVMMSYEESEGILFSADAFGSFGALGGKIFSDENDIGRQWFEEAGRYYTNIVGKYGPQVQSVLKKASELDIKMIAPLHGPVWRDNISRFIDKYLKWSAYEPEEKGVLIAYASMYGNTQRAAESLRAALADRGVKNIRVRDVSATDVSRLVYLSFRYSNIVVASCTYNLGLHPKMEQYLSELKALDLKNRTISIIENGSWAPAVIKCATRIFSSMKNMRIMPENVKIKSALHDDRQIQAMADAIVRDME